MSAKGLIRPLANARHPDKNRDRARERFGKKKIWWGIGVGLEMKRAKLAPMILSGFRLLNLRFGSCAKLRLTELEIID